MGRDRWLAEAAARLGTGAAHRCEQGHDYHRTRPVSVTLDGPQRVPDYPPFTAAPRRWTMSVFDSARYEGGRGYCTGDDEVSRSLLAHGTWEGYETLAACLFLDGRPPGVVIDVGAHIGWYSLLAASAGHEVLAVESDTEKAGVLAANCDREVPGMVWVVRGTVGPDTPPVAAGQPIRLLKADVEGAERWVVDVFAPCLDAGMVDAMLLEVSPCFDPDVVSWLSRVEGWGFRLFRVPYGNPAGFGANTVGGMAAQEIGSGDAAGWRQENVLAVRTDLWPPAGGV